MRCCPSSQLSFLIPALVSSLTSPAVIVVQNRNALFGRPDRLMPSESLLALPWRLKRELRLEGGAEREALEGKEVYFGVGGREGGCEERAKRKRDVRLLARWEGGVSAARAKWVERGVEGREGREGAGWWAGV